MPFWMEPICSDSAVVRGAAGTRGVQMFEDSLSGLQDTESECSLYMDTDNIQIFLVYHGEITQEARCFFLSRAHNFIA